MALIMLRLFILVVGLYFSVSSPLTLAQAKKILVLGDSLSAAYQIPKEKGWVNLLRQRVGPQWEVINSAVSGATTSHGLNVLPSLLDAHKPNILILELGGNDGLQGKPISHISANLEKLIDLAMQNGAKVVLLGMRLPPNLGERYTRPFYEQFGVLASKYKLPYVAFLLEGVATEVSLMKNDGVHPKAEAQPILLDTVWTVLSAQL